MKKIYDGFDPSTQLTGDEELALGVTREEVYGYKGKKYFVQNRINMKHPVTRKWVPAILYVQEKSGKIFCKEEKEFLNNYVPIRGEDDEKEVSSRK